MSLKIELFTQKETGTGLDGLKREDFKSDEALLEAATQRQMELDNPAYIKARTKVLRVYQEQLQAEAKARSEAEFAAAVKACKLSQSRQREIEVQASKKAVSDFEEGRISATEVDNQKRRYAEELTTQAKRDVVMGERINAALRGAR